MPSSMEAQAPPARRSDLLRASPRLSGSALLDRAVRVSPAAPVVTFLPTIGVLAVLALDRLSLPESAAWAAGGYLLWSLVEYWTHRVVLHFEPARGLGARLHWIFHGAHHEHPSNPRLLLVPPIVSVPLAAVFCTLFWLALGSPAWLAFATGFLGGYLVYDITHYRLHHSVPRTRLGKLLRELHMRHHFQDHERGFGVTAPYWDRVFGTALLRGRRARRSGARSAS